MWRIPKETQSKPWRIHIASAPHLGHVHPSSSNSEVQNPRRNLDEDNFRRLLTKQTLPYFCPHLLVHQFIHLQHLLLLCKKPKATDPRSKLGRPTASQEDSKDFKLQRGRSGLTRCHPMSASIRSNSKCIQRGRVAL